MLQHVSIVKHLASHKSVLGRFWIRSEPENLSQIRPSGHKNSHNFCKFLLYVVQMVFDFIHIY